MPGLGDVADRIQILCFFPVDALRRNPAKFLEFTFLVLSEVKFVLGSQVIVNSHVMRPAAP